MIRLKYLVTLCLLLFVVPPVFAASAPRYDLFEEASGLLEQGSPLEAAALYRRILEGSIDREERARALLFLSVLYSRNLNLPDTAVACLEQIETTYPDTAVIIDARFALGAVSYRNGRFAEAVTHFQRFVELYPEHMRSSSARAWLRQAEILAGEQPAPQPQDKAMAKLPEKVRVLLHHQVEQVILGRTGEPMTVLRDGSPLFEGNGPVTVTTGQDGLVVNGVVAGNLTLTLEPGSARPRVDGHAYRGVVTLWPDEEGISVVNTLPVEEYLYGVLPKEMSPLWPEEALKAQAVASRSYTYHTLLNRKAHARFDLEATTAFQVYGGADAEAPETTAPVDSTKGHYLAFQGLPIIACFHANSGGMTESADAVWGAALPYLKGVKDSFSRLAPDACWTGEIDADSMVKKLWEKGYRPGGIISLETSEPSPSGRNGRVIISTSRGRLELTGNEFRLAMGPEVIRSARFSVTRKKRHFTFEGCGYGHGVGMSQWGARKMAASGFTYDTILHHYYKNVSLVTIDKEGVR
ncbi:SpoIID/LytB domain-containing protein [Desulfoluna butyratoxydans]|uniref:Sporulation stage ii protein d amidase enhancer lytb n=1 Tax=Desulfoluna butyratoxydans TaxID=231438 RepID=A0A4U8YPQ4_9BACT|nr:SpoIID/LytB domain-containing protein [Desulfoluna butyratoxydans]VFQ43672.1 sporulation stage ii protein d amidase enhancer lytb [Desulfoluna butyratoxydans]